MTRVHLHHSRDSSTLVRKYTGTGSTGYWVVLSANLIAAGQCEEPIRRHKLARLAVLLLADLIVIVVAGDLLPRRHIPHATDALDLTEPVLNVASCVRCHFQITQKSQKWERNHVSIVS